MGYEDVRVHQSQRPYRAAVVDLSIEANTDVTRRLPGAFNDIAIEPAINIFYRPVVGRTNVSIQPT